ncbi:DNA polymerase-3 subunit delta [Sphingomonas jinjuensis]|uniref:DNA-directed DNA polymerase n=1 Tax=Sphingomonas jinjuensis TaxID=535907 RepID=A0A840F3X4_9SPHN|nr:DNA polymerase-3 subunit delta [Sphingomonas jinjuensis]
MKVSRAGEIEAALDRASPDIRLYLLHGPDGSAAAAMASRLGKAMGSEAERIDLDGANLRSDPARLADEAASLSLFGGARFVRVSQAGEESLDAVTALLSADRAGNPVVMLAPTVKATGKLVKLAIESPCAMAFACYEPSAADAEKIAAQFAREAGLRPVGDAARRIAAAAAGDRAVMAREVEKLALYLDASPDRPQDLDDTAFDAVGADLGDTEATRLVAAVVEGRTAALGDELVRFADAGTSPIPWLRQLVRRLVALAEMRADIDRGGAADEVMKRHRVFWKETDETARALRRWNAPMLAAGIDRVRQAERAVMASCNPGPVVADQRLIDMTRGVERRG